MSRVSQWFHPYREDDPLARRCWLPRYKGLTWRQVVDCDLPYVEWLLFESEVLLQRDVRLALEDAIADFIPTFDDRERGWDSLD